MTEDDETRLRRLKMRSWRRGMKEMDLILGAFADGPLAALPEDQTAVYEALLSENDQDLYLWITARLNPGPGKPLGPAALASMLDRIADHATAAFQGGSDS